jgi:hypothetical protein
LGLTVFSKSWTAVFPRDSRRSRDAPTPSWLVDGRAKYPHADPTGRPCTVKPSNADTWAVLTRRHAAFVLSACAVAGADATKMRTVARPRIERSARRTRPLSVKSGEYVHGFRRWWCLTSEKPRPQPVETTGATISCSVATHVAAQWLTSYQPPVLAVEVTGGSS